MAGYKFVDADQLDGAVTATANSIRAKTGGTDSIPWDIDSGFASAIDSIPAGGGDHPTMGFVPTEWSTRTTENERGAITAGIWYGTKLPYSAFYTAKNNNTSYEQPFGFLKKITFAAEISGINVWCFYGCKSLVLNEMPASVRYISSKAFYDCISLTELTFKGTPNTIASDAFSGCTNLVTINVPWAEGAVANAPWGATNATINYNYTGA